MTSPITIPVRVPHDAPLHLADDGRQVDAGHPLHDQADQAAGGAT